LEEEWRQNDFPAGQCSGTEKILFSDPDPALTFISDQDLGFL
jgi:hypothetical protein